MDYPRDRKKPGTALPRRNHHKQVQPQSEGERVSDEENRFRYEMRGVLHQRCGGGIRLVKKRKSD